MLEPRVYKDSKGWFAFDENKWGYFIFPSADRNKTKIICIAEAFVGKENVFCLKRTRLSAYQKTRKAINRRIYIREELMPEVLRAVSKLMDVTPAVIESVARVEESGEKEAHRKYIEDSGEFE